MDALEILTDLDHVMPYISADFQCMMNTRIIGYEILGRYMKRRPDR